MEAKSEFGMYTNYVFPKGVYLRQRARIDSRHCRRSGQLVGRILALDKSVGYRKPFQITAQHQHGLAWPYAKVDSRNTRVTVRMLI